MVTNPSKKALWNGSVDLDTDTLKFSLHSSSMSPNIDTWDFRDDLTNEVVGTGYTAGGATLTGKSVVEDDTNDKAVFTSDPVSWASSTITARYGVISKIRGGAASADEIVAIIDFGSDFSSTNGTFTVTPHATGGWMNYG